MDRALLPRVCSQSARDRSAGSMPARAFDQEPRCGAKEPLSNATRPKLGRCLYPRNKKGQPIHVLLGDAPVEMPRVEELLRSLMQGLPPGLASGAAGLREDLENNFRAVLRANLGKLDLAGRDEFDA